MKKGSSGKRVLKSFLLYLFVSLSLSVYSQAGKETEAAPNSTYFDSIDRTALPAVQERQVPDSIIQKLQADDAFWYANAELKKPVLNKSETPFLLRLLQQPWLRQLLWLLIAGSFVAVLIWYLASLNIKLFRARPAAIDHNTADVLPDNIFSIAYEKELEKAVQNGAYRLAVRLLYLQVLTKMADKKMIQYAQDRTNSEYLQQLYGTEYYKDFFSLTRHFEYAWYGQFPIPAPAFQNIQAAFVQFKQRFNL